MKLIGIAGRKGAGKDTFALPLYSNSLFKQVRFADPLKNMLRALLKDAGVDAQEIERMIEGDLKEVPSPIFLGKTPREAMQTLGTEWRNMIGATLWTNIAIERIKKYARGGTHGVVITDVRFPHEVEVMKKLGGLVVRINGLVGANGFSNHASENQIDELPVDMDVFNFGSISDLHNVALGVSESVKGSNV
jgi:hypothetical protein